MFQSALRCNALHGFVCASREPCRNVAGRVAVLLGGVGGFIISFISPTEQDSGATPGLDGTNIS